MSRERAIIQERVERLEQRIREGGGGAEWAKRKSREAGERLDRRVGEGKVAPPKDS